VSDCPTVPAVGDRFDRGITALSACRSPKSEFDDRKTKPATAALGYPRVPIMGGQPSGTICRRIAEPKGARTMPTTVGGADEPMLPLLHFRPQSWEGGGRLGPMPLLVWPRAPSQRPRIRFVGG
jgi:hypothetical protein